MYTFTIGKSACSFSCTLCLVKSSCVAAIGALHFSVRSFGCALFILRQNRHTKRRKKQMDVFCTKCGTQLVDGICPNCSGKQYAPQSQQSVSDERQDKNFKDVFINPKEKFVCSLGNDYIQNFFCGRLAQQRLCDSKRQAVLFQGKGL